ncbi:MAG: DUF4190 domain-containing protein [Christensenellales bacterium]
MDYCKHCGRQISDADVFCVGCGATLKTDPLQTEQQTLPGQPAGYAQPVYQPPYYAQPARYSGMAIAGFVLSLISITCCNLFIFSLLGIIFSAVGLSQTRHHEIRGRGLAVAGLVLSILSIVFGAVAWMAGFSLTNYDVYDYFYNSI